MRAYYSSTYTQAALLTQLQHGTNTVQNELNSSTFFAYLQHQTV
jgi:hypothetical protein